MNLCRQQLCVQYMFQGSGQQREVLEDERQSLPGLLTLGSREPTDNELQWAFIKFTSVCHLKNVKNKILVVYSNICLLCTLGDCVIRPLSFLITLYCLPHLCILPPSNYHSTWHKKPFSKIFVEWITIRFVCVF